jgi:integrase/recombinase XerD
MRDGVLVSEVRVRGPLAGYAGGFAGLLAGQGYTEGSTRLQMHLVAQLSRWLEAEGVDAAGLTELEVDRFIAARRARVERLFRSRQALEPLIGYLRELGAVPARAEIGPLTPVQALVERYRRYLLVERAVTVGTARVYVTAIRPFLERFDGADGVELDRVTAAQVSAFVLAEASRRQGTSIRSVATALRSLLVFLHVEGMVARSLTGAVPGVGAWRSAGLPRPLEHGELGLLMESCDRRTTIGRRDVAILLLLGRLGLRCGEVATLTLDDIDWRAGEIVIYGKGRRDDRLPLPVDVGDALAEYLRRGRPGSALGRGVFVRALAPHRAMGSGAVSRVVAAAAERAGLGTVRAHRLRHTAATELLRAGASLPDVGQVLRHRRLLSTAIYAKVDERSLRELARPWPREGSWS